MATKVTTLFIRDDAINLLEVEGRRVRRWASLPLEPGLVSQGLVLDEDRVAEEVGKLFKLAKIKEQKVIAGISGLNSLYRLISLPELPEAILPEAVKQEARRVIPVPLEEVYLSYQRLPAPEGETRVFLAVFPRNVADVLVSTLRRAGVQPYVMDLAPLALCRTLDEPRAIIINARLEHLDIMVMEDRLPQLIHRMTVPGEVSSLSERLPAIAEEVDRTVAFYNSSHREKPLGATVPMFVCGDLAKLADGWQMFSGSLKSPVSVLPSPVESPDGFEPSDFMVNIGLALKKMLPEREEANFSLVNFNALPEVYLPEPVRISRVLTPIGIAMGIGLIAFMGFLVSGQSSSISTVHAQLDSANSRNTAELKAITTLQGQIKQLEAQLNPLAAKREVFNSVLSSLSLERAQVNTEVGEAVSMMGSNIGLVGVSHDGTSLTVSGLAWTVNEILDYARDLRARFGNVTVSSIKAKEENGVILGYNFDLLVK
jgi:type IV pilus assembly protein PilM